MLKSLYPSALAQSVFHIDYPLLYQKGYRGLIFDIDATLVPHGADSTPEVDALFARLKDMGFSTLLLSNNDEERVSRFTRNIDTLTLCDAAKPDPEGFHRAADLLGLSPDLILVIGDQLFTDIKGANAAGLHSILVRYILWPGETRLGLRRRLEAVILWVYRHSRHPAFP